MPYGELHQNFIDSIIMPFCIGSVDLCDSFVIHDIYGKIIIASNKLAHSLGYQNWHEIKGKTDRELNIAPDNNKVYDDWDELRQKVIHDKVSIYYLNFLNFSYGFDIHANIIFPILTPDGSVAATRIFAKKFKWLQPANCFNTLNEESNNATVNPLEYTLTKQEYEIIFMIYIGLSQEEAAKSLGMSRSNIAKILNTKIYPKFDIKDKNLDTFLNKLNENNVIITVPKQFGCSRCIIIQDLDNGSDYA